MRTMRIVLTKLSDRKHRLNIVRGDGSEDTIELVTREALFHDFLHHAVERAMPTQGGFWGALAAGKTFEDLNDRSGESVKDLVESLYVVEGAVGMMTNVVQLPADEAWEKVRWYHDTQGMAPPSWCTEDFVAKCCESMRRMLGRWKATPFGETMELEWQRADLQ